MVEVLNPEEQNFVSVLSPEVLKGETVFVEGVV